MSHCLKPEDTNLISQGLNLLLGNRGGRMEGLTRRDGCVWAASFWSSTAQFVRGCPVPRHIWVSCSISIDPVWTRCVGWIPTSLAVWSTPWRRLCDWDLIAWCHTFVLCYWTLQSSAKNGQISQIMGRKQPIQAVMNEVKSFKNIISKIKIQVSNNIKTYWITLKLMNHWMKFMITVRSHYR